MRVRVLEQQIRVRRVGRQKADDARGQEVERGLPLARIDGEADRTGEKENIAQRVSHRHALGQDRHAAHVDVRRDQEHPREQCDTNCQDRPVERPGGIAAPVAAANEDDQARHEGGVDRDVEGVAERRERDVGVEQTRVAVGIDIAQEVEELPDGEEPPRRPRAWLVDLDPDDDRHRRGQPEQVDEGPASGERRHRRVQQGQHGSDGEVPAPHRRQRRPPGAHQAARFIGGAAASPAAGWSSKRPATSVSVDARCSTWASVFAAVIWMRNPTSRCGTIG